MMTGRPVTGMVLLYEWHVALRVRPDLDDTRANGKREELGGAPRQWANERTRPGDHYNLIVQP